MANIEDFMKALAGTDGIGKDNIPLFTGQSAPVTHQAFDLAHQYLKAAADGAAGTATADTLIWSNPYDFSVVVASATLTCTGAGITADNTNFATITLKTNDGVGGATGIALTLTTAITDSGNISQNQPKLFTAYTGANAIIPPKGGLWLNIAKAGAGVVVPISFITARLQKGVF